MTEHADTPICICGYSRQGLEADNPCPECGEMKLRTDHSICSRISRTLSLAAIWTSGGFAALYVILLIHHELTDGRHGDEFIVPLPLFAWLFLVLPLCVIAAILTLASVFRKEIRRQPGRNLILILAAAALLPVLFTLTTS